MKLNGSPNWPGIAYLAAATTAMWFASAALWTFIPVSILALMTAVDGRERGWW
jgi:hypothetical protein